jgi:Tol biopolymer transport system component
LERHGQRRGTGQVRIAGTASTTITYLLNNLSEHTGSIFRYDLSSKEHKQLYRLTGGGLSDAAVSPDGTKISFTYATAEGISRVQIVTLADGSTTDVSTLRPNARAQLMWFPDGASLLMSGRLGQQNGIWRVPVRAGEPQRLRLDVSDVTEARLSGDAKRIAYTRQPRLPAQVIAIPTDLNQK